MTPTDTRSSYTAGLRALADLLDAHPQVPLPHYGTSGAPMAIFFLSGEDPKAALVAATRAFPGPKQKGVWDTYYDVQGSLHGLHYKLTAFRDAVCERIVTGTREVVEEVPDPEALAAVPKVTVTTTVEDVEWKCSPLLAPEPVSA